MEGKDSGDGKQNTADMTQFVQTLLQQMAALHGPCGHHTGCVGSAHIEKAKQIPNNVRLHCFEVDEMGERISELEQSINDLRAEMGAEGPPPPAAPSKKPDDE